LSFHKSQISFRRLSFAQSIGFNKLNLRKLKVPK